MRFASIALQAMVVLMMSGSAVAGPREFVGSPGDSADLDRLRRIISPHIEGDTLVIEGRIDSHHTLQTAVGAADAGGVAVL